MILNIDKKTNGPSQNTGLTKHNSVPSIFEPNGSGPVKGGKNSKGLKASNYESKKNNFLGSSTLARNGDYAMQSDTWQRVDIDFKNKSSLDPLFLAILGIRHGQILNFTGYICYIQL